jgi:hypothetical protein
MKTGDKVLVEGVVDFELVHDEDLGEDFVRVGIESPYKYPHGMTYVMVPARLVTPKAGG